MKLRADYEIIKSCVPQGARVLDIGCGDGGLMALVRDASGAIVRGMEINQDNVAAALAKGLSVVQGDADTELSLYPDNAFDVVVLSRTIQAMRRPLNVLTQMRRIGDIAIISIPNFAHWRVRMALFLSGKMPVTGTLPTPWYETDNIHLCSLLDFADLVDSAGWAINGFYPVMGGRAGAAQTHVGALVNMLAQEGVFVLKRV